MSALIEQSSENRRPRRSSFTQQLQRILHIDKQGDASSRESISYEDTPVSIEGFLASAPHQSNQTIRPGGKDNGSRDYVNYGPSEISSTRHSRHSYSSFGSKVTALNASESRHSSIKSFHLEPQQPTKDSSVVDHPLQKQDINTSLTASHSVVQKKDRRATKRLEAERLELEKRLLKLEEAERTGDVSVLRRESRRLIKKQPLGSSSRSSSASGDESRSRSPSRLSSIFSSVRRRSRSRSRASSIDGETQPNDNPTALPTLSSTLPERLSTAISKELAARNTALIASPEQSTLKIARPEVTEESTNDVSSQPTIQNGDTVASYSVGSLSTDDKSKKENAESDASGVKNIHQPAELDRALFTASLISGKKGSASTQAGHSSTTVNQTTHRNKQSGISSPEIHISAEVDQIEISSKIRSTGASWGSSPMSMLTRASTDGTVQRNQRKFKSSPLAESQTIDSDISAPSTPNRATTFPNSQASDLAKRPQLSIFPSISQTSEGNMPDRRAILATGALKTSATESRIPLRFSSRTPTSKPSQSVPSALLIKPRFYNSLGKVIDPPSGRQPNTSATLSPSPRTRDTPNVPPKSPKRNSWSISQSPDHRPRPTSSQSGGPSQDSDSDYNTADEAASVISSAAEITRAISRECVHSSLDGVPLPAIPIGSKPELKKQTRKQAGSDQVVAKLFVICCRCKFWHDMPSEVYAGLSNSDPLSAALDHELAVWEQNALPDGITIPTARPLRESSSKSSPKSEAAKCCWCEHHMSKQCCQGWTTVVHMRQRHH